MQALKYEFILEAEQPVCHSQENIGNESVFMRRKVRQRDGSWAMVPYLTGDTFRHGLRDAGAYVFLDAAGLLSEDDEATGLGEAALRLLFTGGMTTGRGDAARISMDAYRELSELCPQLAMLGGCTDNRIVPGRIECDEGTLVCHEQRRYLPEWVTEWENLGAIDTCRAHIENVTRVRMDPTLDPGKRKLLSSGEHVEVTTRLANAERAHHADDALARDDSKSSMMPRTFERLAQGSLFWWGITAYTYSELDRDTFRVMVAAFLSRAKVGGKKGTGHGLLRPVAARDISVARPAEKANALTLDGQTFGNLFRAHVADRKERILSWLEHVNS
jgi:hypothetical protein